MKIYLIYEENYGFLAACDSKKSAAYYITCGPWVNCIKEIWDITKSKSITLLEVLEKKRLDNPEDFLINYFNGKYDDEYEIGISLEEDILYSYKD